MLSTTSSCWRSIRTAPSRSEQNSQSPPIETPIADSPAVRPPPVSARSRCPRRWSVPAVPSLAAGRCQQVDAAHPHPPTTHHHELRPTCCHVPSNSEHGRTTPLTNPGRASRTRFQSVPVDPPEDTSALTGACAPPRPPIAAHNAQNGVAAGALVCYYALGQAINSSMVCYHTAEQRSAAPPRESARSVPRGRTRGATTHCVPISSLSSSCPSHP